LLKIEVHSRINEKRPDISDDDVVTAWRNAISMRQRDPDFPDYYAAAGFDTMGRLLQMIAVVSKRGDALIVYHAMPVTRKMRRELNL